MSLPNYVWQYAKSPEAFQFDVTPSDTVPDLSGVSAASFDVYKPGGIVATWTATLSEQTVDTLKLTHVFASDASDVAVAGSYRLVPKLTIGGETRRVEPTSLVVRPIP